MSIKKAVLYSANGEKEGEQALPELFSSTIREDMSYKYFRVTLNNTVHPYGSDPEAGRKHSASGRISHQRHNWGGHYGKGISRIPRKTMWRRGTQFSWVGAEVSNTRGGRRAHAPHPVVVEKNFNRKEITLAMNSALASTFSPECLAKRYSTLSSLSLSSAVISSLPQKSKDFFATLEKIFGKAFSVVLKKKETRAGRGKSRNRRYKSNAGLLLISASNEEVKFKGVDAVQLNTLSITDLYPLGRLTLFTKKAIEELSSNVPWRKQ